MTIFYFFYEYLAEGLGGLNHIWEVSRHLHQLGHRVVIFVPRCGTYRVKTPVDVIYVPTIDVRILRFFSFHFNLLFYAGYYMLRNKVDVIYVREMVLSLTPYLLSKLFSRPMITEINGDILTRREQAGHHPFLLSMIRFVEMIVCRQSSSLICVTEGLSDIFKSRYNLHSKKVRVIPNGTNTDRFYPLDQNDCRKRLEIDPSIKVVGFIGTFLPHQGISFLVESSSLILEKIPDALFLLVGDGPSCNDIKSMVQYMGLSDHFLFTGAVPQEEVVFFINAMDVCVAPFTRKRNERIGLSPLKLYDYLACGKPLVASDIMGVGDLLRKNKLGITVTPEDSASLARGILLALEDSELSIHCLQNGPVIINRNFTWEITSQKVAEVCYNVLKFGENNRY